MLSTKSGERPFKRLARTAKIQETVFLGTRAEADKALAAVHRLHERVKGELPEAAGAHPAGAPYSAFDPELMLWTLAVIADSGRAMYETMVRPLSAAEREALWQDYVRFGELFGLPASEVPASYREFRAWFDGRLASPDLHATAHALEMAPLVAFEQPVPPAARGNLAVQNHIIKGTLPPRVREIFGIAGAARHEAAFRSITAAHRRARPAFPRQMRRGRNDVFFDVVTKGEHLRGGTAHPEPERESQLSTLLELLAVAAAGAAAGASNALAGAGSLITFPTLIALGVPPLSANVTSTVGLIPGAAGGAIGYADLLGNSASGCCGWRCRPCSAPSSARRCCSSPPTTPSRRSSPPWSPAPACCCSCSRG